MINKNGNEEGNLQQRVKKLEYERQQQPEEDILEIINRLIIIKKQMKGVHEYRE